MAFTDNILSERQKGSERLADDRTDHPHEVNTTSYRLCEICIQSQYNVYGGSVWAGPYGTPHDGARHVLVDRLAFVAPPADPA